MESENALTVCVSRCGLRWGNSPSSLRQPEPTTSSPAYERAKADKILPATQRPLTLDAEERQIMDELVRRA